MDKKTTETVKKLLKAIEKETGKPTQIIIAQPCKNGLDKKVVGALIERKGLVVKMNKEYQDWSTREKIPAPVEWKKLEGNYPTIEHINKAITELKIEYLKSQGIEVKPCPEKKWKMSVYKCPKCGSFGGEEKTVPGASITIEEDGTETKHPPHLETYTASWNQAPSSMWVPCQMCGAQAPSLGPFDQLKVFGSLDHGYALCVDGPNMGSAGGPTYISVGKIIFPLLP